MFPDRERLLLPREMKGTVIRIFLFPDRDPGLQHARGRKESRLRNAGTAFVPGRFVKKMIFSFYNGIFCRSHYGDDFFGAVLCILLLRKRVSEAETESIYFYGKE